MDSDYVWYTDLSKAFLGREYLLEGQTLDERVDIICNTAERILKKPGFAKRFKKNIQKGWYSLSSPIWSNFGTDRGMPISCFGSLLLDTTASIAYTTAEVMMMTKNGGGTSAYFGNLRGRGEKIKNNGESSGSVHFMQIFDKLINVISQGSSRRGNFAAALPIDHKDILEFLAIRSEGHPIQDLSFGVCVPDYWMQEMIDGDEDKRRIWAKVLQSRSNTGYPYIFFTDNANKNTVDVYKDKIMKINHSNLCVTGDQRVVSDRGLKTAKELYEEGGDLVLFDNKKVVNASPMILMEKDVDVYKITLSNGMTHTVTGYHKVKVRAKWCQRTDKYLTVNIMCSDLKIGDKVGIQTNKGIFGQVDMQDEAFLLGFYQGDGTQTKKIRMLDVWENDFDLLDEIQQTFNRVCMKYNAKKYTNHPFPEFKDCVVFESKVKKKRLHSALLKDLKFEKGVIPNWIWEANEETQWSYLKGLFFTDGSANLTSKKGTVQVKLPNINKDFLRQIQLILSNLGITSSLGLGTKAAKRVFPDGYGGKRVSDCKDCFNLTISNSKGALLFNEKIKFLDRKNVFVENRKYKDNIIKFHSVKSIEYVGKQDVYCCKVNSEEHHWICNGFITHNCQEIMLPDSEDESFVCDLSSANIFYYDEWKDTDAVELLAYFLDAVMTEFIEKAKKIPFMERAVRFAERHRALGIGWLGWHSYLQNNNIAFESMQAKYKNVEIAKNIKEKAYAASAKMAVEYGEPELLKGYGRRNTTLLAIAPTKSSAFIAGQVSEGIEPHRTNYYIKDLQKGKFTVKNAQLEKVLEDKGFNNDKVWGSILKNGGSVQHLEFLSEHEKNVFKTFSEISQREIIIQASQRQKYIDQGQSLNLMIHPSIPIKEVNALILESWKLGIKSLYYQISVNAAQAFSREIMSNSCKSCES